jgi:C-5 cytosine-specific DNA methylase
MTKPLAIDLYCGLGGWADGLLAENWRVIGFDIERHQYGEHRYPATLVIQDVLTLHGSQFQDATLIVASPPCQAYSYRAMPWKRAKALPPPDNTLFEACFRIQREACEAAGRHIPMVVENVRGAQKWVGRARWNYGSFYLWGDVPALMPITFSGSELLGFRFDNSGSFQSAMVREGFKSRGMNWSDQTKRGQDFTRIAGWQADHIKCGGDWFNAEQPSISRLTGSKSSARKAASAMIAKIPLPLAQWIAAVYSDGSAEPCGEAVMASTGKDGLG